LSADLSAGESCFSVIKTLKDALNIIKRPQSRVRMIFLSTNFGIPEATSFVAQLREMGLDAPVTMLVHQQRFTLSEAELAQIGAEGQLVSPSGQSELLEHLKQRFPEKHNWSTITASAEKKGEQVALLDQDFMPIVTEAFLLTDKCFFNVFIRLADNKFVKILNAGDPFDSDFAEKYSSDKFKALWVKKSEHHQYIHLSEKNTMAGLARGAADVEKRIAHLGDNVSKALSRSGISEDNLLYADRFLGHTVAYLRQMKFKDEGQRKFFEELARAEHPAAVSVVAGLLAQKLGFESTKAIKIIGLAALLHDIAIYQKRSSFPAELPLELTGDDLLLYNSHTAEGAKFLQEMELFDEAVIQAVAQHHQKHSIHAGKATTLISEIVASSDLFCHMIVGNPKPRVDYFLYTQLRDFRPQIGDAFEAILKKKARAAG